MISIAFASVAGGRLVGANGYADADRTADFGRALARMRPDVLTELERIDLPGSADLVVCRLDRRPADAPGRPHPRAGPQ